MEKRLKLVNKYIREYVSANKHLPTPTEAARDLNLPQTSVRRYFARLGFDSKRGKIQWNENLAKTLGKRMTCVYEFMVSNIDGYGRYPTAKVVAETFGVTPQSINSCIRKLRYMGLLSSAHFGGKDARIAYEKERVYQAILAYYAEWQHSPSLGDIRKELHVRAQVISQAISCLVAEGRVLYDPSKHRSIEVVEYIVNDMPVAIGNEDIRARLLHNYVSIVRDCSIAYQTRNKRKPERKVLQKLSGLSAKAFNDAIDSLCVGGVYSEYMSE